MMALILNSCKPSKNILCNLRFDDAYDTGYVFVYDVKGVNIAHGVNASLEETI